MRKPFIFTILLLMTTYTYSQELVQWRGQDRDGKYNETGLLKQWPAEGPKLLWHFDGIGDGHASAAVTADLIYTAGTVEGNGFVFAFDHNGNLKWKTDYGPEWVESWPGSRTTPMIYDGKLYIMSGFGKILCMNPRDGLVLWSVDYMKDYDGRNIQWGVTENLLIDEGKLYCTPGGVEANVIALNKDNGQLIWKSKGNGEKSAYCSPALIKHNNRKIIVTHTESSILGIDASNGNLLWKHPQPNQWSVHPNTPIYSNGYLYCVSGYGQGGVMLKLSSDGSSISEVWRSKMQDTRMGAVVLLNGKLYGSGDKSKKWFVLDWNTGKELGSSDYLSKPGNIIYADGMLYCYSENGDVAVAEPKDNGYNFTGKFKVPYGANQHWAHLVIKDKKLYVRHGNSLMVYSIAAN